jgi:calcineurin-like phosphoesterase family protein
MSTTYFTSDCHWNHARIIQYCNRPFADVDEMNRVLVERWNETVTETDTVYCLGDFCWTGYEHIFHRLNGIKHLIIGNHDSREIITLPWASQPVHYLELSLKDGEFVKTDYRKRPTLVLNHYSMRVWNGSNKGVIMLYGHSHNTLPGFRTSSGGGTLDVGCDCWDFRPVNLDQIKARIATLPEYTPEIDRRVQQRTDGKTT